MEHLAEVSPFPTAGILPSADRYTAQRPPLLPEAKNNQKPVPVFRYEALPTPANRIPRRGMGTRNKAHSYRAVADLHREQNRGNAPFLPNPIQRPAPPHSLPACCSSGKFFQRCQAAEALLRSVRFFLLLPIPHRSAKADPYSFLFPIL